MTGCELEALTIEHLRGFDKATVPLGRGNTVLVGPNNSGKTSLLRILDWLCNSLDDSLLLGTRPLSAVETELLLPARETRGGARRLTLWCRIHDGRRARGFQATAGLAQLRIQIRGERVFAALGKPRRGEGPDSEPKALRLLGLLREDFGATYIPSSRDAEGDLFSRSIHRAIRYALEEKLIHRERGGAPADYRRIKHALDEIEAIANPQVTTLWDALGPALPTGLVREAEIDLRVSPDRLVDWLATAAELRVSTGQHDLRRVSVSEVGSGTQSLILMAVLQQAATPGHTVLLEEPEAFLHPSVQRALARSLFDNETLRTVIATHSPVVVDEAVAADVVLVRDHKIFAPRDVDSRRRQINSALLTGQGSEAIFSRSVLLVEGPGDRAFFERLRRRLGTYVPVSRLSDLGIVAVGGKAGFAPWIQLLESYVDRHSGERPIHWLAVADGADAATDLARGLRDGGLTLATHLDRRLRDIAATQGTDQAMAVRLTRQFNQAATDSELPANLVPIDLEYSSLSRASDETVSNLIASLDLTVSTREELLSRLGSKWGTGPSAHPLKQDWIRAEIAGNLPWPEVSGDVKHILRRWLAPVLGGTPIPAPIRPPRVRRGRRRSGVGTVPTNP